MRLLRSTRQLMLAALLLPTLGHAAYSIDHVGISCSSSLTQAPGDALNYLCDGDLNLLGDGQMGQLTSDTAIILSATGSLTLDHLTLTAPRIELGSTSGVIFIGADTRFFASPGGVHLQTSVPEPSSSLLAACGLLGLAWLRRKR